MEALIEEAIRHRLDILCFTEHMDMDYPSDPAKETDGRPEFLLDTDSYREGFLKMKEKYEGKITLLFGVELGLQPHLAAWSEDYAANHDFDFIIGSVHTIGHMDPYYPSFFEGRSEKEAYVSYFEEALLDIRSFSGFNTLGHLDYVVRYGPNRNRYFSYREYADYIDPILEHIIQKDIALEVNSAGYRKGLGGPNPCRDIILRYKEMGGELVTVGSDAHTLQSLCSDFGRVEELLLECGIKYHAVFIGRRPRLYPLG